jgi:DNA-directed RNA polymerase specialized sigma24 family protein
MHLKIRFFFERKNIMEEVINKRRKLDEQNVLQIMSEWNQKSIEDFAEEFQVAPNTVRSMVYKIRKKYPEMCPKKSRKTREDIIEAAFKLFNDKIV